MEEVAEYESGADVPDNWWFKSRSYDGTPSFLDALYETERCGADFSQTVKDRILTWLPIRPDICIVRGRWSGSSIQFNFPSFDIPDDLELKSHHDGFLYRIHARPIIFLRDRECRDDSFFYMECKISTLHTEIHELCHVNQDWYWLQNLSADTRSDDVAFTYQYGHFVNRADIQELIKLVGFTHPSLRWRERSNTRYYPRDWRLPSDSIFREIYSDRPGELAAELCAMYLMDKIGAESRYRYIQWTPSRGSTTSGYPEQLWEPRDIDINRWLTPEIREWLETYMILPALDE